MTPETQKAAERRLSRIAGQVGGIERMIRDDRYCVDVLLQISAVRAALDQVGKLVLRSHVETCVADAMQSGDPGEKDRKIEELLEVFARYGRMGGR